MESPVTPRTDLPSAPPPLLPPVLLGAGSFLWFWVLPIGVLGVLNLLGYRLVGSELDEAQRGRALLLGWAGLVNLLAGVAGYLLMRPSKRRSPQLVAWHPAWGLPGVLVQVAYLWLAMDSLGSSLLPANITAWIYPEERFLFNQFAFCMLPAFHGILRLAAARPPVFTGRAIAVNLALAAGSPVVFFLLFHVASALERGRNHELRTVVFSTLVIVLGVLMFVGLVRAALLLLRVAKRWHATGERWAVVLLALALPLAGLTLNRTIPFPVDFQASEVYVLTVANALTMLLAVWTGASRPRLCWHLLCATFPFALYFFIVFLPFTPLSILAVIVMGAGMLVLTPTLLFALHLHLLGRSWCFAVATVPRGQLLVGGALAVLLLPAFFTVRSLADKAALNAALDYLYTPAIKSGDLIYGSSLTNLRRAVNSHRDYKEGLYYPILSDYYSWLVFDNLVLPDDKLAKIEQTFFGTSDSDTKIDPFRKHNGVWGRGRAADRMRKPRVALPPQTVDVATMGVLTKPADALNTIVTVTLTLRNTGQAAAEFQKALALPSGVFVNGFRLQVGDTLVPGRIFEKKTALWVYSMIRDSERRDPGILYFRAPGELELRVFPILPDKPVAVEIDLLIPVARVAGDLVDNVATIDALMAGLSASMLPTSTLDAGGGRVVCGLTASSWPAVEREPYLHIILDRSTNNGFTEGFDSALRGLKERFPQARVARVSLANYDITDLKTELTELDRLPKVDAQYLRRIMPLAGGLALDLALAQAIRRHRDHDLDRVTDQDELPRRPVFVILSRGAQPRSFELPLVEAWSDLLTGLELFEMGADGSFVTHGKPGGQSVPLIRSGLSVRPVGQNQVVRFSGDDQGALRYWAPDREGWQTLPDVSVQGVNTVWNRAVELYLRQQEYDRSPGEAGVDRRDLIKQSRESGVLVSSGSYIVVENQAQWRMLESGEQQKLAQNQALDFLETPAPPALWVAVGFGCWLAVRLWWKRRHGLRLQVEA